MPPPVPPSVNPGRMTSGHEPILAAAASASASVNVLFFTPYVGVGYDYSSLKVKDMGAASGQKSDDGTVRYTAGVNFHPLPLVYVYGAYTYTKYSQGFQGGVGLNF